MKNLFLFCCTFLFCSYSLQAQTWEQLASHPGEPRNHPVTFSIDGFGYLLTGGTDADVTGNEDADFYRYDPSADSWEQLLDFPAGPRSYAYGVAYQGKAYVGFGNLGYDSYKDLWEYNSVTEQWT